MLLLLSDPTMKESETEMGQIHKFTSLRHDFPEFTYDSFSTFVKDSDLVVTYKFIQSDDIIFEPSVIFRNCPAESLYTSNIKAALFNLGMIEIASYYKACCSPRIIVRAGALNEEQLSFWKKLIYRGLGEFLYRNGIETTEETMFDIIPESQTHFEPALSDPEPGVIIPVGGGKDSVVTLELLKGTDCRPLILNPREASVQSARISGYDDYIRIERSIDPLLLKLNEKGFLNGHTPFSALLGFVSAAASLIYSRRYIALSNENSANEGNTFFSGIDINHQYSKSYEAEEALHGYIRKYISRSVYYFSFLRPLNELAIARLFSRFGDHFSTFRSCNVGSKENKWCLKCPKCLFTYIMLSPFNSDEDLMNIFGKNLLDDTELEPVFLELCGFSGIKPFECVGTVREVRAALAKKTDISEKGDLPVLLKIFSEREKDRLPVYRSDFVKLIEEFSEENLLPNDLKMILEKNL